MARTITLTTLEITRIELDYVQNRAAVWFCIRDDGGQVREELVAHFWVTPPQNPAMSDFLLPQSYVAGLLQLRADAQAALESRYLV